ncbi:MAG TPA: hypothetical protein VK648_08395 [Gemmatimonadaceae bacterium]|nr:MAG: hypothetical protein DMF56_24965 [Acidobacteriota bacterium]HTD83793.1 hypothetical protein [Gemmatimonadaceae bacterium]
MNIEVQTLAATMTTAASGEARGCWPLIRRVAEMEFARFAQLIEDINQLHAAGEIDSFDAFAIVSGYRVAAIDTISHVKGLGKGTGRAAAREAMRAAVDAARGIVDTASEIRLL